MVSRDERQEQFIDIFEDNKGKGTLEACTAFGKTRTALKIIRKLRAKNPTRKVVVIVPLTHLKEQWETLLRGEGLMLYTVVDVINTAVKRKYNCSLLVLDEIHRYAATTFAEVFNCVEYQFILGLTATISRLDRKHHLLKSYCPVIDKISVSEARANEWIADYNEYNLAITLSGEDQDAYKALEEQYAYCMEAFMHDFGLLRTCAISYKPKKMVTSTGIEYMDSACASLARKYGWEGVSADIAWDNMLSKKVIWDGNLSHTYHPKKLYIRALNGMKALKKIRMFVQNHHSKIEATVALCDAIRAKTITFSETTEMADKITREINKAHPFPIAIAYHSKSRITVLGKLLSNKKSREYILESLKVGEFSIVNSAKALDEGADMPEMLFGIRVAGTSSPTQQTQRRGRLLRKHGTKEAIMVNLYLLGTKEMQWLSKSQGYDIDIHWVESIREILDDLGL